MKWVLITPHQGLGDHLLCNGLYRQYSAGSYRIFISVKRNYHPELSNMLRDLENITLLKMPNFKSWKTTRVFQLIAKILRIRVVGLGSYGSGFFPKGVRFDNNFYDQAGVDFKHRWDSFHVPRNQERETELFELLNCQEGNYVFLHEDTSRSFTINRELLPEGYRVITPLPPIHGYYLVDYRLIIERAFQVHVIESSFAAFVESIPTEVPLFAHRYARHHALNDFRHEFTYRKKWKILI
jgi:hypothetical protein